MVLNARMDKYLVFWAKSTIYEGIFIEDSITT
jgi:hypothetical protein